MKDMKHLTMISCLVLALLVWVASSADAQSASGRAYGAYVKTPVASLARAPLATLTSVTDGDIATASADALSVPSTLSSNFLDSRTVGSTGEGGAASAQSVASLANISILDGLITVDQVIASTTSTSGASGASSNADGSTFENLVVAGVAVTSGDGTVEPNTRITLPGTGYVVLNEQIPSGDGVTTSGLTVNMIHVVLTNVLGSRTGEIIVGSATSSVTP